ncbi:glycoside hydrolase/deacetylase [Coniochaeta ligniaria NRRL 30616]|uniref:Glycoside hydrolase/deacetylase n=1 Tax=Coniochaeta ligniaria NRRL 30616 TaxID=1408157 RepID=A0A1J7JL12_9PEZI|nr:glycoside hydrolase/deacetylase [Coniochaeta ligniaria NRRL 30616]
MKWSSALMAASCGLVAAHGDLPIPRIVGGRKFLSDMRARHIPDLPRPQPVEHVHVEKRSKSEKRQSNTSGQCGQGYGSCAVGYCCSSEGWCGKGSDYCTSPDCQINYGPGCDGNRKPSGLDTSSVPRPKLGNVLIAGAGIYDCVNAGEIAVTFDDGPYLYTNDLLDKFKSYGARATFFITGNNIGKGMINDPSTPYPAIIRRMHAEGHQIASHTWSHENASALTNNQFTNQMIWNEIAFNSILGFFPAYMRPPYSICAKNCQNILSVLGYHAIYFDLDTEGYLMDDPKLIQTSKNIWDKAINPSNVKTDSFLNIEHDIHYQTVYNLTDYMLASLFKHGYKSVTVGQCLGDPETNWYRAGPGGLVSSFSVTDGQCGQANGATCSGASFGKCCSVSNACVDSTLLCLAILGCQSDFGACL